MKTVFFNILLLLICSNLILYADANIDAQIEEIKHASVKDRFKLMNAFKKNLSKMKEEERINAMTKLTIKSNNKHAKKALEELKQHTKRKNIEYRMEYHNIGEDNIVDETNSPGEGNED